MQKRPKHYFVFGDFQIDVCERVLLRNGNTVPLTPKAFDTLLALVESRGGVVEKEEIFSRVWPDTFVAEVTLARNISTLRKAFGEGAKGRQYIETVPKRGYRFVAEVTESWEGGESRAQPGVIIAKPTVSQVVMGQQEEFEAAPDGQDRGLTVTGVNPFRAMRWRLGLKSKLVTVTLLASLIAASLFIWSARKRTEIVPAPPIQTIAVLPLNVVNPEAGDEYLGVGIADRLIGDLTKLREIIVRPTSAVLKYVAKPTDPVQAGRALAVDAVLVGSVQKTGDRLRNDLQLVRICDGEVLWVKNYDGQFRGIFGLQDEIAHEVTRAVRLELRTEEKRLMANRGTQSVEAYQAYMHGRFFQSRGTFDGRLKAIEHFQQALILDPNYALAYVGLADCYALQVMASSPFVESYQKAKSAVLTALALDDTLGEVHTSLGWIKLSFEWDWDGAEKEFQRAIELSPNYPTAHYWYGIYLSLIRGNHDEALAELRRAQELDPTALGLSTNIGALLTRARRDDDAIVQLCKVVEMDPNYSPARLRLGDVYARKGMYEAAVAELQAAITLENNDPFYVAELAAIYAMGGQKAKAIKIIEDLKKLHTRNRSMAGAIAAIYADLNDKEEALRWLAEAFEARDPQLWLEINGDRRWDILLSDGRFTALLQRMGLKM